MKWHNVAVFDIAWLLVKLNQLLGKEQLLNAHYFDTLGLWTIFDQEFLDLNSAKLFLEESCQR